MRLLNFFPIFIFSFFLLKFVLLGRGLQGQWMTVKRWENEWNQDTCCKRHILNKIKTDNHTCENVSPMCRNMITEIPAMQGNWFNLGKKTE